MGTALKKETLISQAVVQELKSLRDRLEFFYTDVEFDPWSVGYDQAVFEVVKEIEERIKEYK